MLHFCMQCTIPTPAKCGSFWMSSDRGVVGTKTRWVEPPSSPVIGVLYVLGLLLAQAVCAARTPTPRNLPSWVQFSLKMAHLASPREKAQQSPARHTRLPPVPAASNVGLLLSACAAEHRGDQANSARQALCPPLPPTSCLPEKALARGASKRLA